MKSKRPPFLFDKKLSKAFSEAKKAIESEENINQKMPKYVNWGDNPAADERQKNIYKENMEFLRKANNQNMPKYSCLLLALYCLIALVVLFWAICFINTTIQPVKAEDKTRIEYNSLPIAKNKPLSVKDKIIIQAKKYNVNQDDALRIAECESQFGKYPVNWDGGSAKGIYMFINKTWKNYCKGDVMNEDDNILCFMKLYPKYKSWWLCQ